VLAVDQRAFGLTKVQLGRIAYSFAVKNGIEHPFKGTCAGRTWVETFMKAHNLSMRKPENTSAARLMAFNKENVDLFFQTLGEIRAEYRFPACDIYNVDETGVSTVPTKDPKTISPKGNRRVIKISSAERGINVTAVCCMNSLGQFIPPAFIFPRVRDLDKFLQNAPAGSKALGNESGWMTNELFLVYLEHFVYHARPSEDRKVLLILDNHSSHVSLEAIEFCRAHHIVMLGFPAHTSDHLQPLDVSVYGPLKTAVGIACHDYLITNPGRVITIADVPGIFKVAYRVAATEENGVAGFRATGIQPFNSQIFTKAMFAPAATTDRPLQVVPATPVNTTPATPVDAIPVTPSSLTEIVDDMDIAIPSCSGVTSTPTSSTSTSWPLVLPKAAVPRPTQKRGKLPSMVLTSSPVKAVLLKKKQDKEAKKAGIELRKKQREEKRKQKEIDFKKNKKLKEIAKAKKRSSKKNQTKKLQPKKMKICESSSEEESSNDESKVEYAESSDYDEFNEDECLVCGEFGKTEDWFQCSNCKMWAHADCTGWMYPDKPYVCDLCVR